MKKLYKGQDSEKKLDDDQPIEVTESLEVAGVASDFEKLFERNFQKVNEELKDMMDVSGPPMGVKQAWQADEDGEIETSEVPMPQTTMPPKRID